MIINYSSLFIKQGVPKKATLSFDVKPSFSSTAVRKKTINRKSAVIPRHQKPLPGNLPTNNSKTPPIANRRKHKESTQPASQKRGKETPLGTYLREIHETPLLSASEERELAARIAYGDKIAKDHLVKANLRLVVNIARAYSNRGLPLQDLIEEGNLGVMRAAEDFDPNRARFSTHASYWIKQNIKRAITDHSRTIRIPVHMWELRRKAMAETAKYEAKFKKSPELKELAAIISAEVIQKKIVKYRKNKAQEPTPEQILKWRETDLKRVIKHLNIIPTIFKQITSTEINRANGEPTTLEQVCPNTHEPSVGVTFNQNYTASPSGKSISPELIEEETMPGDRISERNAAITLLITRLEKHDERAAFIIRRRFLDLDPETGKPFTLKQVGETLELTKERVRQLEADALQILYTLGKQYADLV